MAQRTMECILLSIVALGCLTFALNVDHTFSSTMIPDRLPLYDPDRCSDPNQMLYPVENDTWTCDCGPGFIYYKPRDACYVPYREGPCQKGYHLIYVKETRSTECVKNPCQDGFARYNGKCYEIGKPTGPCKHLEDGPQIFDVNTTTLKVECLKGADTLHLFDVSKNCGPGSRRDSSGKCREMY